MQIIIIIQLLFLMQHVLSAFQNTEMIKTNILDTNEKLQNVTPNILEQH